MDERLASKHVVLLGVGHTNAHIVRMWGQSPIPDADLTCITDNPIATYSGMLPAVLAGQVPPDAMEIDLVRLCAFAGARLIIGTVSQIDSSARKVFFEDRPPISFDALSIGIGSVPTAGGVEIEPDSVVRIKPMQTFLTRLTRQCERAQHSRSAVGGSAAQTAPLNVVVVGSGAAGIEITFCLPGFLRKHTDHFRLTIVTRSAGILPGSPDSLKQRVQAELSERGVEVLTSTEVRDVTTRALRLKSGETIDADIVIWATGAAPPPLLSKLDLPKTADGFLAVDQTLQTTSGAPVFAVGDTGSIVSEQLPKAGVYAVRQGPILWENLQRILDGRKPVPYHPQRSFLKLINKGDGTAFGERSGFSFGGRWVMKLKDRIDSKFMAMYQMTGEMPADVEPMQCRGCGCKLGGDVLQAALENQFHGTDTDSNNAVPLDDAAIIETGQGRIVASTDFFSSPVNDPYLAGRIAALHSASDLVAMGADIRAALANVVVPAGDSRSQRQGLDDVLTGAREEFTAMGAEIVGGHTIVGSRWEIGFTVIGQPLSDALLRKDNLRPGDQLYITKPIGIGILLAAHMRGACPARHYVTLMDTMLQRQHPVAEIVASLGIDAGTDITGFGLIGHLIEMLTASAVSATLELKSIPMLPGAADALISGIESTLAPANRHVEPLIEAHSSLRTLPEYRALFDPQTCGGLLLGVRQDLVNTFEERLQNELNIVAARVGEVVDSASSAARVSCN